MNELKFINYLENKKDKIEWWFKNGDSGSDYYSLKYFNSSKNQESLFYPDWIIKFKDGKIGIFDTKSGITALNPEGRAEGLANKLISLNKLGIKYIGGLIIIENGLWYCHIDKDYFEGNSKKYNYRYIQGNLVDNWIQLDDIFNKIGNINK